jgi:hypothetical protein
VVNSYRDLEVWQKAMDLVVDCYRVSDGFPKKEVKEHLHHLAIGYGSLLEVETHLQIAVHLRYVEAEAVNLLLDQASELGRMLNGLITSLKRRLSPDAWPLIPDS